MHNPITEDGGWTDQWRPQFLSILRIVTAGLFLAHGTSKILGFPASTASFPPPWTQFWMAGMLELVGGALLHDPKRSCGGCGLRPASMPVREATPAEAGAAGMHRDASALTTARTR